MLEPWPYAVLVSFNLRIFVNSGVLFCRVLCPFDFAWPVFSFDQRWLSPKSGCLGNPMPGVKHE